MLDNLIKTYPHPTGTYKYPAMIRQEGTVIAFAMDDQRRIYYTILDLENQEGRTISSPLDVNYWLDQPKLLEFPNEIAEVGVGIADQDLLPTVQSTPNDIDRFRSSTARFTADAPFQVMADGQYVYLFRQAIAADHSDILYKQDAEGNNVIDAAGNRVPIVNSTLLVDRFVLSGTNLVQKREVRFRRSRSKTRPQSNKDTLGATDLDDKPFYEPTQELSLIQGLSNGRFSILLLPTQVVRVERWQIFVYNDRTQQIDAYNVERSADGLFNTRGSQQTTTEGEAEFALRFQATGDRIEFETGISIPATFTQEAWIYPAATRPQPELGQALLTSTGNLPDSAPSIWIVQNTRVRIGFGDGQTWHGFLSGDILTPNTWNHLAVTYDGQNYQVFVNGELRYQAPVNAQPFVNTTIVTIGDVQDSFEGRIDEIRIWDRARSQTEIQADLHQRLTGQEFGLVHYWRLDEGSGTAIADQTGTTSPGILAGGQWVISTAPIGSNASVNRDSFRIEEVLSGTAPTFEARQITSGLTSLLYYQQENAASGYTQQAKPLKQSARVMLAMATHRTGDRNEIAVLDFGVSADGRLVQVPDNLRLPLVNTPAVNVSPVITPLIREYDQVVDLVARVLGGDPSVTIANLTIPPGELSDLRVRDLVSNPPATLNNSGIREVLTVYLTNAPRNAPLRDLLTQMHTALLGRLQDLQRPPAPDSSSLNQQVQQLLQLEAQIAQLEQDHTVLERNLVQTSAALTTLSTVLNGSYATIPAGELGDRTLQQFNVNADINIAGYTLRQAVERFLTIQNGRSVDSVRVYSDANYRGEVTASYTAGAFINQPQLEATRLNDRIRSIRVPASLQVTLYEHQNRGGDRLTLSGSDIADLGVFPRGGFGSNLTWLNVISSLEVITNPEYDRLNAAFTAIRQSLESIRINGRTQSQELQRLQGEIDTLRQQIRQLREQIDTGVSVPMVLLHSDRNGLTLSGAILGFAWTPDTPRLYDSATGNLALYFRGNDNQFFVTYYSTLTQRARYSLMGEQGLASVECMARSVEPEFDRLALQIEADPNPELCTLKIGFRASETATTVEPTETWTKLPRDPYRLTQIINGLTEPTYIGSGTIQTTGNEPQLFLVEGVRRSLPAGAALSINNQTVILRTAVAINTTILPLEPLPTSPSANAQGNPTPPSVYWLPYNYANASSTQSGVNLANGSVLILATTTENNSPIRLDSFLPAPSTLSSQWVAAAPGYTLSFSDTSYAYLADVAQLRQMAATDDLTLEAWVRPQTTIRDRARILHYQNTTQSYTLALQRQPGSPDTAPAYSVIAGVNQLVMQSRDTIPANRWTHLAVAHDQAYAVELDNGGYLDCGNNPTLDIRADLTIEVFLQIPDLRGNYSLLSKGVIDDGTSEQVPYALFIQAPGRVVFLFEDTEGTNLPDDGTRFASTRSLTPGQFHKIAVTRRRRTEVPREGPSQGQAYVQYDINFYIDGEAVGSYTIGSVGRSAPDVGGNSQALKIGEGFLLNNDTANPIQPLRGVISEVRLWNTVRTTVGESIRGDESGLVSWWQFEENTGRVATDSKSNNHARFNGNVTWINTPDPDGSRLVVYRDGIALNLQPIAPLSPVPIAQFTLGGLRQANNSIAEFFYGELEEVRIWARFRTEEQLQDNRFGRLLDERADLIAYYTFDAETNNTLSDRGLRGNQLAVVSPNYTLSTAPIGEDTPQVRNALLGTITPFSDGVHSSADVQEYGDLQYDAENNLTGSFKRCYTYIKNGQWQIISGFKVGDLVAEWVGQSQFDPQLIGYIEGAPPVPSENLSVTSVNLGEFVDYDGASTVEVTQAQTATYTYASSRERGFNLQVEVAGALGFVSETDTAVVPCGVETEVEKTNFYVGVRSKYEHSQNWLTNAATTSAQTTQRSSALTLTGRVENPDQIAYPAIGRRFLPDNVGFALVESATGDVFALRLRHNNALVSYQMRPNPDIPRDRNIISFPINPFYTKQGTLDGKIGLESDDDYPNALTYSPDTSYFKPIEAYALRTQIQREEEQLKSFYEQYDAAARGTLQGGSQPTRGLALGSLLEQLPSRYKRNLVNTYVWTADGGLFAETQESLDTTQESFGGSYTLSMLSGLDFTFEGVYGKVGGKVSLQALFGGRLNVNASKSINSQNTFGLNVQLDKVERNIFLYDADGRVVLDSSNPRRARPVRQPGKVDAYRFFSFYLEPDSNHFDTFFQRVVDPIWLEQSDDPNAIALRQASQTNQRPPCWRVMHRVTYVSRVLPPIPNDPAMTPLERRLPELNIDSNYELIRRLSPFVINKINSYDEFTQAVRDAVRTYLPELQPHIPAITQVMQLYYGVTQGNDRILTVNAGSDRAIDQDQSVALLGRVFEGRTERTDLFVSWSKQSGPGDVTFTDPNALTTTARFTTPGTYTLRLTASQGVTRSATDDLTITVLPLPGSPTPPTSPASPVPPLPAPPPLNQPPRVNAGLNQLIPLPVTVRSDGSLSNGIPATVTLNGSVTDDGLPQPARLVTNWRQVSGPQGANFANPNATNTTATLPRAGRYVLQLTATDGELLTSDDVEITVTPRVTQSLQALYTFTEGSGTLIRDVSGAGTPLDLTVQTPTAITWLSNGLSVTASTQILTTEPATRLIQVCTATNEVTIEAWVKPGRVDQGGPARIVSLSGGIQFRNATLQQGVQNSGQQNQNRYGARLRTTRTDLNGEPAILVTTPTPSLDRVHLVYTRDRNGIAKLYVNSIERASATVNGDFSTWDLNYRLLLANEVTGDRPWLGEYYLVALYNRALSTAEVRQNFASGT
jgi:prefoldin subunit 5